MELLQQYWPWAAVAVGVLWLLWSNRGKLLAWWPKAEPEWEPETSDVAAYIAWQQVRRYLKERGYRDVSTLDRQVVPAMIQASDGEDEP